MTTLSASTFRDPLLKVLFDLSGGKADVPVKADDTYRPVMDAMGIADENEHGINEASGKPWVHKWIQWANNNLRKAGLTKAKGRGKWALTDEGVASQAGAPSPAPKPVADPAPKADPKPAPVTPAPQTQSRHTGYHPDSYVVTVASSQTPCFGAFSSHGSSVCSDCPLRRECQAKMYSTLSTLAVNMKAGKVKVPKAKGKDKADGTTTPAADDGTGTPLDWSDPTSIDELVAVAEAPCGLCGKPVKAGEHAYWSTKDNGYLYHIDCGNRSKP